MLTAIRMFRIVGFKRIKSRRCISTNGKAVKRTVTTSEHEESLKQATTAIQEQERLLSSYWSNLQEHSLNDIDLLHQKINEIKEEKSELEGTNVKCEKVFLKRDILEDKVKHFIKYKTVESLKQGQKDELKTLIEEAFGGSIKKLLFAGVVSCPWYRSVSNDPEAQAKNDKLFVVFQYKDNQVQVVTPVSYGRSGQNLFLSGNWFHASEAQFLVSELFKGNSKFIECLSLPEESIIYASEEWQNLKSNPVISQIICSYEGFIPYCHRFALLPVATRSITEIHTNKMAPREGATLFSYCEACRLLHYTETVLLNREIKMETIRRENLHSDYSKAAFEKLQWLATHSGGDGEVAEKDFKELFDIVIDWKRANDLKMKHFSYSSMHSVAHHLGTWLYGLRCDHIQLKPIEDTMSTEDREFLEPFMKSCTSHLKRLPLQQVLMVANAGSHLYGLATPESDNDHVIVYVDSLKHIVSRIVKEQRESAKRGPMYDFEFTAFEAGVFTDLLYKGSIILLELMYAEDLEYASDAWKILTENRHMFVTENAITNFFGLIRTNLKKIKNETHIDTPKENKVFYQIFHKLNTLQSFLHGEVPQIKCVGAEREFIMRIRTEPLQGDLSRENLYSLARERRNQLKDALNNRTERLPENIDYDFLQNWLKHVRGWPS